MEFEANATTTTFTVPVNNDSTDEDDQTFTVTLSNPSPASLVQLASDPTATGTIEDDDGPPTLTVADVRFVEGTSGGRPSMTVSLSEVSEKRVRFRLRQVDRTGDTASDADWSAIGSAFNAINAGTMSVTRSNVVTIINDTLDEDDETLTVEAFSLENAQGSSVGQGSDDHDRGQRPDADGDRRRRGGERGRQRGVRRRRCRR